MLESCRDRNVVQFLGSCSDGAQTLLVTECAAVPPCCRRTELDLETAWKDAGSVGSVAAPVS